MKRFVLNLSGSIKSITIIDSAILIVLLSITFFMTWYMMRENSAHIIAQDVEQLATVFDRIDKECGIIGFEQQKNPINFLTLKKDGISDGNVGSMRLEHPENWQGPYVDQNPTIQGKLYEIIKTRTGYFIVPGDGVKLPNGLIIGKDIRIDADSPIACMVDAQGKSATMFEGKSLIAGPLHFTGHTQAEDLSPLQEEFAEELV